MNRKKLTLNLKGASPEQAKIVSRKEPVRTERGSEQEPEEEKVVEVKEKEGPVQKKKSKQEEQKVPEVEVENVESSLSEESSFTEEEEASQASAF